MIVLFNHIPKTGGNSFAQAINQRFDVLYDYVPNGSSESFAKWREQPIDASRFQDPMLLVGHFTGPGCRPHERYPDLVHRTNVRLVTVLRNPTELALSHYFYRLRLGEYQKSDFRRALFDMVGIYAHTFSIEHDGSDLAAALKSYSFVGITEHMGLSLEMMARDLGIAPPQGPVPFENASARIEYPSAWQSTVHEFDEAARLDHLIYRQACENLLASSNGTVTAARAGNR
ncbi:hypothetical protein QTI66_10825 [Variovorax sp. J22R133]|uniref:hypothetical protein n=1 Tax=Variovorax brevis TaxID=3053503 RepID=UPI002577ABBC|nr:hypothetical protein [Variovorax sp. J22R133]MDM0112643.1 hypothetical protein [Variovorax sp. J22R133]